MIRVGLVGAGGMGAVHAAKYARMHDVELLFFDAVEEKALRLADKHGGRPTSTLSELIARSDVVDICLPTDLHLDVGLQAIAAGRAVLMEKPMASTVAECGQLIEAADRAGIAFMPAQVVRFFPEFAHGSELVRTGAVGRPAVARTRRGGKAPTGQDGWFRDSSRSGGVILDLAIHDLDWLRWTLGEVREVYARSVLCEIEATRAGESERFGDFALITLEFESGALSHTEASWMDPSGFRTMFEVCGSEGMIEFDSRSTSTLRVHGEDTTIAEAPLDEPDDPYYRQIVSFLDAVRANAEPPVSGYDGLMAVSLARAAIESARRGLTVVPEGRV